MVILYRQLIFFIPGPEVGCFTAILAWKFFTLIKEPQTPNGGKCPALPKTFPWQFWVCLHSKYVACMKVLKLN